MKKILSTVFAAVMFLSVSCTQIIMPQEDVYYIRYEASADVKEGDVLQVAFNNLHGKEEVFKFKDRDSFSVVVGPVESGFNAYVSVNTLGGSFGTSGAYTALYISKNNGPFAYIASNGGENHLDSSVEYTIDF